MNRKQQEKLARRNHVLDAAGQVFGHKPFDEATMQEIATEAEIGMQGLYAEFSSKQELYEALILRRAEHFQSRAEEATGLSEDPLAQLETLAEVYAALAEEQPHLMPLFVRDRVHFDWNFDSRFKSKVHAIYEIERQRLQNILEQATEKGCFQGYPVDFLAQLCLQVLDASIRHHLRFAPEEARAVCVKRAMDCFLKGTAR